MIVVDSSVFIAILEQDCAAYALAKVLNVPLLFKGVDFSQTDIQQYV